MNTVTTTTILALEKRARILLDEFSDYASIGGIYYVKI